MIPTTVERLRPRPADPEPEWSAATLRAVMLGESLEQSRKPRSAPISRRRMPVILVAAGSVVALSVGLALPVVRHLGSAPVLANPVRTVQPTVDGPVTTDRGRLSTGEVSILTSECRDDFDPSPVDHVHYSRRIGVGSDAASLQAAVLSDRRGEYRVCLSPHQRDGLSTVSSWGAHLLGPGGQLTPTREHPLQSVVAYQRGQTRRGDQLVDVELVVAYATAASIDRVQIRVSEPDHDAQWFEGSAFGGFVVIPVSLPRADAPGGSNTDLTIDARAYDKAGEQVGHDHQGDLDNNHGITSSAGR